MFLLTYCSPYFRLFVCTSQSEASERDRYNGRIILEIAHGKIKQHNIFRNVDFIFDNYIKHKGVRNRVQCETGYTDSTTLTVVMFICILVKFWTTTLLIRLGNISNITFLQNISITSMVMRRKMRNPTNIVFSGDSNFRFSDWISNIAYLHNGVSKIRTVWRARVFLNMIKETVQKLVI